MKTKLALTFGIIVSITMIVVSVIQMNVVQESRRDYRDEQEHNRAMGYNDPYVKGVVKPYAKKTRAANNIMLPFVLSILAVSLLVFKNSRQVKWISIFNYILILFSIVILGFSLIVVRTTTGGITFDEIGVLWIILGVISIVFSSIGLAKIPK